jgi:hypothetical protein
MTMRRMLNVIPMILLAMSLPAFSAQAEAPAAGTTHRIQVYQAGKGAPRVREAAAARKAAPRAPEKARDGGLSQPYQPAKPGEGEPKG